MSDHKPEKKVKPPQAFGWMAEYDDENKFLEAARKVRDSGYTKTDAFAPFPVHGIDEALGIKPTVLPWFTLIAGATGTTTALVMQIWMNAVDYPYIISGKPFISLPAFIPVTFELTVLFAAFTTVFAMLGLNGLPKFSNPVFTNPKFDRVTDDRFFIWVDSRDKYFNSDKVKALLENTSPLNVEEVREDDSTTEIPRQLIVTIATLIIATLIPAVLVWNIRAVNSESPRWHVFFDMDFMPYRKAQKETTIFADGRTQRPPVAGTVARGAAMSEDPYYMGYTPDGSLAAQPAIESPLIRLVSQDEAVVQPPSEPPAEPAATDPPAPEPAPEKTDPPATEPPAAETPAKTDPPATEPPATEPPAAEAPAKTESPATEPPATTEVKPAEAKPETPVAPAKATDEPKPEVAAEKKPADTNPPAAQTAVPDRNYLTKLPEQLEANDELFALGRRKFEQVCSACHGFSGFGNGLVSKRAEAIQASYWLQPTSVHDERILKQPIGQVYYTITNGKGKMAGYGSTLNVKERWAVALYVKALQRSQHAEESDLANSGK
jgi:mono/diheme cytochrome c family protein